jgi:GTP-binding protein
MVIKSLVRNFQKSETGRLLRPIPVLQLRMHLEMGESRGELFIGPGVNVYQGMIVGLYQRNDDLEMNVCKAKHLTNMRSSSSDGTVQLTPFTDLSLEQCIDFIEDDELLEVTPKNLRLRKRFLDPNQRKRAAKN